MLGRTNLILCAIAVLIPLTHGITCYVNNLQNQSDSCKYCAFGNITSYVTNWKPEIIYKCLQDSQFSVEGIGSTAINKCQEKSAGGNLGYHLFTYVCDKDRCNDACHSSASAIEVSNAVIMALLGSVFVIESIY
uniref:Protein sleepless n=1 Tax=Panagrellus redivivus TaxID=6233 RepID=A0A7E4ZV37_PANRE